MAARKPSVPRAAVTMSPPPVADKQTARAMAHVDHAVQTLQELRIRDAVSADLVVGSNHVRHSLGRSALGYTLTPTVADASFAHALDTTNPRPDREVWITVIGVPQPGARIEVY